MIVRDPDLSEDTPTGSRALTLCDAPSIAHQHLGAVTNDPSFVTQLMATAKNLPQTRHRRRAEPREALAAYTSGRGIPPARRFTSRFA